MSKFQRPRTSVFIAVSLDGFIATKEHGLAWLDIVKDPNGEDYGYKEFMSSVGAVILGRKTYDVVRGFGGWFYEGKQVLILTHRPLEPMHGERPVSGALGPILEELHRSGVQRVYLDGGQTLQAGLRQGLVDDLTISVIPILLGGGVSLFGELSSEIRLRHRGAQSYPTGLVQVVYDVRND